jgi:transposase
MTTQTLDWYETKSPHTKAYDRHLMLQLIGSTVEDVSRKEEIGYDAVEGAIKRCIEASPNWDEFDDLKVIGIDEIALTKGRKNFIAIVSSQQADGHVAILSVLPDRKKETVRQFLESIPHRLRQTMATSCTDMWEGYVNAVKEFATDHPEVSIDVVIDRYHVAKNYRDCVDKMRKQECRRLKKILPETKYNEVVKGMMWIIRKNNRDLTPDERKKLRRLFKYSPQLKLAYTFREELTAIFALPLTKEVAKIRLLKWADKVRRSTLTCFDKFLTTLNNWLHEIVNYFVKRLSSGFVEGLNNKIKTIKRRCYGILRGTTLFQRLYLDLEGYRRFA